MKKNIIIIVLVFIAISSVGFYLFEYNTKLLSDNDSEMLSYEQYSNLFKKMDHNLKLVNFEKVSSSINTPLLGVIDKNISFNTRSALTYSGELNDTKVTQNRIEYSNIEKSEFISIDLVLLKKLQYNDLAFIDMPFVDNDYSAFNKNKFEEYVLTYKNTMVMIKIFSKNEDDKMREKIISTTDSVVKLLSQQS